MENPGKFFPILRAFFPVHFLTQKIPRIFSLTKTLRLNTEKITPKKIRKANGVGFWPLVLQK